MDHKAVRTLLAALLLMAPATPALASDRPVDPEAPVTSVRPVERVVTGTVTYQDLEGGFYAVDGWMLVGDQEEFARYLGKEVRVTGTPVTEPTIQQVPALRVTSIELIEEEAEVITVTGKVTYEDLEGGFYSVDGWMLMGDQAEFARYLGQTVVVTGTPYKGPSIYMVKALQVKSIAPVAEDEPAEEITVIGPVIYRDLEGGFYSVDGWMLMGDETEFARYLGQTVVVTGTPYKGPSIYMVRALQVKSIRVLGPEVSVPKEIRVDGKPVSFDQGPEVIDGVLMIPLRAVVEAAGGEIEWLGETRQVRVRMLGLTVIFTIGEDKADLNEDGVSYFARNLVPIAKAPVIMGNRTLVSVDALALMGLYVRWTTDGVLEIWTKPDAAFMEKGTIAEISDGETFRFLLKGEPMANGEPMLMWVTVPEDAVIIVGEKTGTTDDLKVGQTVEVTLAGPILESYPALGYASAVRVVMDEPQPPEVFTERGTITEIDAGESFRFLLKGGPMSSGEPTLIWVTVPEDAVITVGDQAGTIADLKVGQTVEVTFAGPLLLSYPAQGGAAAVRVLLDVK